MQPQQEKYGWRTAIVLVPIFAFVFGVLGYVGEGLLQIVKWQAPDPKVIIPTAVIGAILGIIIRVRRRNQHTME